MNEQAKDSTKMMLPAIALLLLSLKNTVIKYQARQFPLLGYSLDFAWQACFFSAVRQYQDDRLAMFGVHRTSMERHIDKC